MPKKVFPIMFSSHCVLWLVWVFFLFHIFNPWRAKVSHKHAFGYQIHVWFAIATNKSISQKLA